MLSATGWIDVLGRLIAIDTSTHPGRYSTAFGDVLQDMFAPLGFGFRRISPPCGTASSDEAEQINMIAARPTGRPVCTFYFHTDTIRAGEGWTKFPFALSRHGNRLYGRGAADMKGAMAAVWAAFMAADAVGLELAFDPVLVFCTDREFGCHPGLQQLAEAGLLKGPVLCLDGPAAPHVWAGCLGSITLAVTLEAPQGPGLASLEQATAPVLDAIAQLRDRMENEAPASPALPPGVPPPPLLSVSPLGQGTQPGQGQLIIERRYSAPESYPDVLGALEATLRQAARQQPDLRLRTEVTGHCAPVTDPDQGPNRCRWQQSLGWGFGYPPESFRRCGSSEGSPMGFLQQAGLREVLRGGLRRQAGTPGPDEFTTVEDVEALARSVLAYLSDIAEVPRY